MLENILIDELFFVLTHILIFRLHAYDNSETERIHWPTITRMGSKEHDEHQTTVQHLRDTLKSQPSKNE